MALLHIWHEPGCATDIRQLALQRNTGHDVVSHELFSEPRTAQDLLHSLIDLPIEQRLNPNAPRIRSGKISPTLLDTNTALKMLIGDPLLIRRSLIETKGQTLAGFDTAWLGLDAGPGEHCSGSRETCQI